MMRRLLARVFRYDYKLLRAARSGDLSRVKALLKKGANINAKDERGRSPLYKAVKYAHNDVVEFLIARGADVNSTGKDGRTPLHRAAHSGQQWAAEALIVGGADVNRMDSNRRTPLDVAVSWAAVDVAKVLRKHGAKGGSGSRNAE